MTDWWPIAEQRTLKIEGRYSDHPHDPGGKTMWGITEHVARAYGYTGAMQDMPLSTALAIYKSRYWDLLRLDEIAALSGEVACEMFDTGVNMGQAYAAVFLQDALNFFNKHGASYPDVKVDGTIGPLTVYALRQYFETNTEEDDEQILLLALNCQQGARYLDIAKNNPKLESFAEGWYRWRVQLHSKGARA